MNGNVTIVRKSGSSRLYISYQFNGKAVVKSTGLLDTKANRKNLQTKILEYSLALLARRDPLATAQKLSYYLDKVLENAKNRGKSSSTQATYTSGAKKALKILGDYPIADYTTSQIESMIDEMVI
jgi:hypothetical protein